MSDTDESETSSVQDAPPANPAAPAGQPRGAVAWLALLLALLALLAVGYTIYEDWRTQRDLELSSGNIEASITNLATRIDDNGQGLAATRRPARCADAGRPRGRPADRRAATRLRRTSAATRRPAQHAPAILRQRLRHCRACPPARAKPGCSARLSTTYNWPMRSCSWHAIRNLRRSHSASRTSASRSWRTPRSPMFVSRLPMNARH